MRFVHDRIFPVLCHLCRGDDRDLFLCANYLHQTGFQAIQLGLPEDFCVPLTAAVSNKVTINRVPRTNHNPYIQYQIVELSGLDMCTTPLDRLTCLYDTVQQIRTHIKSAVQAAAAADGANVPADLLPEPSEQDMILLIATCIVHSRPQHLMSTLNYADLFAWSVPIDMM